MGDLDDGDTRTTLRRLWALHGLLLFREISLTPQFQIRLGSCFGVLQRHEATSMLVEGHPELVWLTADRDHQAVFEVESEQVVGWFPWHSDTIWRADVVRGGLLGACVLPERGGDTGFMCRIGAYERLPSSMRRQIDAVQVVYKLTENIADHPYILSDAVRTANPPANEEIGRLMEASTPPVAHPLVVTQRETGRKYLNFSPMGARHILGLDDDEAHDLLMRIAMHMCDAAPAYRHRWEAGDIVLWDNWRMNHRAFGTPLGERRAMQRATIFSCDHEAGR